MDSRVIQNGAPPVYDASQMYAQPHHSQMNSGYSTGWQQPSVLPSYSQQPMIPQHNEPFQPDDVVALSCLRNIHALLKDSFIFNLPKMPIDWSTIAALDIGRIERDSDIETLQMILTNVVFADLNAEAGIGGNNPYIQPRVDPGFLKLMRISQMTIEYLLRCQEVIVSECATAEQAKATAEANVTQLRDSLQKEREAVEVLRRSEHSYKRAARAYALLNGPPKTSADQAKGGHPCPWCAKVFTSRLFLEGHLKRRHGRDIGDVGGEEEFSGDEIEIAKNGTLKRQPSIGQIGVGMTESDGRHIRHALHKAKQRIELLERAVKTLRDRCEDTEASNRALEARCTAAETELVSNGISWEWEGEIAGQNKNSELVQMIHKHDEERQHWEHKCQVLQSDLDRARDEVKSNMASNANNEEENNRLRLDISNCERLVEELRNENSSLKEQLAVVESTESNLKAELKESERDIEILTKKRDELEVMLSEAKKYKDETPLPEREEELAVVSHEEEDRSNLMELKSYGYGVDVEEPVVEEKEEEIEEVVVEEEEVKEEETHLDPPPVPKELPPIPRRVIVSQRAPEPVQLPEPPMQEEEEEDEEEYEYSETETEGSEILSKPEQPVSVHPVVPRLPVASVRAPLKPIGSVAATGMPPIRGSPRGLMSDSTRSTDDVSPRGSFGVPSFSPRAVQVSSRVSEASEKDVPPSRVIRVTPRDDYEKMKIDEKEEEVVSERKEEEVVSERKEEEVVSERKEEIEERPVVISQTGAEVMAFNDSADEEGSDLYDFEDILDDFDAPPAPLVTPIVAPNKPIPSVPTSVLPELPPPDDIVHEEEVVEMREEEVKEEEGEDLYDFDDDFEEEEEEVLPMATTVEANKSVDLNESFQWAAPPPAVPLPVVPRPSKPLAPIQPLRPNTSRGTVDDSSSRRIEVPAVQEEFVDYDYESEDESLDDIVDELDFFDDERASGEPSAPPVSAGRAFAEPVERSTYDPTDDFYGDLDDGISAPPPRPIFERPPTRGKVP